jgi:hypothetical protein
MKNLGYPGGRRVVGHASPCLELKAAFILKCPESSS